MQSKIISGKPLMFVVSGGILDPVPDIKVSGGLIARSRLLLPLLRSSRALRNPVLKANG